MRKILLVTLLLIILRVPELRAQEKIDFLKWMNEAESLLSRVNNYAAIFHKQEGIHGKLCEEETILFKFKRPFKVYMKWVGKSFNGREVIYADGWNRNKIRFHEGGIMGIVNLNLEPTGSLAMKGNRHPITHSGLEYLVKNIKKDLLRGNHADEIKVHEHGEEFIYGNRTKVAEGIFPKDPSKGYYCYRIVLNLDVENKLPIRVQVFEWDNKLVEKYGYENLNLNPGLTEDDFDPKNPAYKF
jgi:hypothetical protein